MSASVDPSEDTDPASKDDKLPRGVTLAGPHPRAVTGPGTWNGTVSSLE